MLIIKKCILILGKCPTQGLDNTTLTAEAEYSIKLTKQTMKILVKSTLQWKQQLFIC